MRKFILGLLFSISSNIIFSQTAIYVDSSVISSGNGSNWASAKKSIKEALNLSSTAGDTIKIAKGIYYEDTTLFVKHEIYLFGGYPAGGGESQDTNYNRTIIDGKGKFCVIIKNNNNNLFINYLIIQNGKSNNGGGISFNGGGKLIIDNSIIRKNNSTNSGGGIYASSTNTSTILIAKSNLYNNTSGTDGGGIYIYSSSSATSIILNDCKIYSNASTSFGGGLYSYSSILSSVLINNSDIYKNTSGSNGGGISSSSSSSVNTTTSNVNLNFSRIYENKSINGAGIYSASTSSAYLSSAYSNVKVDSNSSIYNNTASNGGGGIFSNSYSYFNTSKSSIASSIVLFKKSLMYNNSSNSGGGIYSTATSGGKSSSISLINLVSSNIFKNVAKDIGGGLYSYSYSSSSTSASKINLNTSSIYKNKSSTGGGLYSYAYSYTLNSTCSSIVKLNNSSVYNNTSINIGGIFSNSYAYYNTTSSYSTIILKNSSIFQNTASTNVGGLQSTSASNSNTNNTLYSVIDVVNSIIASNIGGANPQFYNNKSTNNFKYSYVSGFDLSNVGTGNFNALTINPLFIDTAAGNFHLQLGSPLTNIGIFDSIPKDEFDIDNDKDSNEFVPYDIEGHLRIINDTVDLGAYETCINSKSSLSKVVCSSFTSPSSRYIWSKSGIYFDTITNSIGCDSIITITLTVNSSFSNQIISVCQKFTSPTGRYIWTKSGIYKDTFIKSNSKGCDSIITIYLSINNSFSTQTISTCYNYNSLSGKYTYTKSGNYIDTITNFKGCDSIINIYLTIKSHSSSIVKEVACNSYTSPSGRYFWTKSGTYLDTLKNFKGCDSIINIYLTVNSQSVVNQTLSTCNNYLSPSGRYIWGKSGTYSDTLRNFKGCDSIINIYLTVNFPSVVNQSLSACNSYLSPSGRYIWTKSGTYLDTLKNFKGCDSLFIIDLIINSISINTVSINGKILSSDDTSSNTKYQWVDCNKNFSVISKADNKTFTPVINGFYAVILSKGNCIDTSDCLAFDALTITTGNTSILPRVTISPNPTSQNISIKLSNINHYILQIHDEIGKEVFTKSLNENLYVIDVSNYKKGIYILSINYEKQRYNYKIVIN